MMALSTPFRSELPFAALITYGPRGTSPEHVRSRNVMLQVKDNRIVGQMTMAEFVAHRIVEIQPLFLEEFLGRDVALIPVPRSSLQKPGALWPGKEIADALLACGFGNQVLPCLSRVHAVTKAATAASSARPRAADHLASLQVTNAVALPSLVTLVDDVVTRGAQLMGAAWALWKVRPDLQIRAFAVLRTISDPVDFIEVLAPTEGTISIRGGEAFRVP